MVLDWVRRAEAIETEGAGPSIKQLTNAYGFSLPRCAADWVAKRLGNGPTPDRELARREVDAAEVQAMLDQAGTGAVVDFLVSDNSLKS